MNARRPFGAESLRAHLVGADARRDREDAAVDRLLDDRCREVDVAVVKMMSAPWPSSFAAHAFAIAGLLPWVSQVTIWSGRPMTPPFAFTAFTRIWAAASAGPSNGAMPPLLSKAQPITIGFAAADAVPRHECHGGDRRGEER